MCVRSMWLRVRSNRRMQQCNGCSQWSARPNNLRPTAAQHIRLVFEARCIALVSTRHLLFAYAFDCLSNERSGPLRLDGIAQPPHRRSFQRDADAQTIRNRMQKWTAIMTQPFTTQHSGPTVEQMSSK